MTGTRTRLAAGVAHAVLLAALLSPVAAIAQAGADTDRVVVFGRAIALSGEAQSASEGIVGYADFETRPLLRAAELVEVIPGMIAAQHSQGGKANQYYLRGFNLDHGTDFSVSFDGVPLNLRSHPHMNGYLDINFMIPEIVQTVAYRKGSHYVDAGDFSIAASAHFETYDRLDQGFAEVSAIDHGEYRLLLADSAPMGGGDLLYAFQYEFGAGHFDRSAHLKKGSGIVKYTRALANGAELTIEAIGYDNSWFATDQMPLRAVESGLIGRFGTLDPDLGGKTHRYIGSAKLDWGGTSAQIYVQNYALDLYGNPTFFLADPVNGDQFVQVDRRWSFGGNVRHERDVTFGAEGSVLELGADAHYDDIGTSALFPTVSRMRNGVIRDDAVQELQADAFASLTTHWTERLRTTVGVRGDFYAYDVTALQPENSGDGSDAILTPKLSAAYAATDTLELYAAYGRGFHSNAAQGAVLTVDPVTGQAADSVDLLVKGDGGEFGFRYEPSPEFNFSAAYFALWLDSELIFVGDAGTSEPSDATHRQGIEASAFWRPVDWLAFDASGAWSDARFRGDPPGGDHIPNSLEFAAGAGATVILPSGFTGSLRVRHMGESPLIEDNSVRAPTATVVNLGLSQTVGRFTFGLDVLNLLDAKDYEIAYFYESQLPGEAAPVEDIHFHPFEPRGFRFSARARF
jgi:outer membrane receptor protein involved in Fe transport